MFLKYWNDNHKQYLINMTKEATACSAWVLLGIFHNHANYKIQNIISCQMFDVSHA